MHHIFKSFFEVFEIKRKLMIQSRIVPSFATKPILHANEPFQHVKALSQGKISIIKDPIDTILSSNLCEDQSSISLSMHNTDTVRRDDYQQYNPSAAAEATNWPARLSEITCVHILAYSPHCLSVRGF